MLFKYLSVEWLFLAIVGVGGSAALAFNSSSDTNSALIRWALAALVSLALYVVLRLGGKTPIGITYESHPAAKRHPYLSFFIAWISVAIWAVAIFR